MQPFLPSFRPRFRHPSTLEGKAAAEIAEPCTHLREPVAAIRLKGIMGIPDDSLNLLQGTLDFLVLKALVCEPRHGYAVARWIRETTDDALQIEEGALYTALHRMEKRGWLESSWGLSENKRRAKFYGLTPGGANQLRSASRVWTRYAEAVSKVLGAPGEVIAAPEVEVGT